MIVDESGLLCICGQWVDGGMHSDCRSLMSKEDYERWSSKVIVTTNREQEHD